jgi:hypothetical protein
VDDNIAFAALERCWRLAHLMLSDGAAFADMRSAYLTRPLPDSKYAK